MTHFANKIGETKAKNLNIDTIHYEIAEPGLHISTLKLAPRFGDNWRDLGEY